MTRTGLLIALMAAGGFVGLTAGAPARAQTYICPAGPQGGERSAGWTPEGNGIAAMPLCWDDGGSEAGPAAPRRDVQKEQMDAMSSAAGQLAQDIRAYADASVKLQSDPGYQRFVQGSWRFFQARADAKPGEYCTALWSRQRGFFGLAGPGPGYPGGLITFWGPDIPKTAKSRVVTASIRQSDGSVQTVKAANYMLPGIDWGAITLAVPSIEAGIDDMADEDFMELSLGKKVVARAEWRQGLMAKQKLRQCMTARKR